MSCKMPLSSMKLQIPKTWDNYLKLLMQAYKALHLDKAQGAIFGPEAIGEKSRGKKDLNAMEIDEIQRKSPLGPSKNKNQSFRAWLIKMLEKDSDDPDFPPEDFKINSTSIEEIPDPVPPSRKGKLDFPLGL